MRTSLRLALLALASALPASTLFAQTATQRPAITGIAYVRFAVADQAAENAFFARLGYQPQSTGGGTSVFYLGDTMRQHIDTVVGAPVQLPAGPSRLLAIGLQTSSLSQMQKYLAAKGVSVGEPANHRLTVHDPEGNVIEFTDVVPHTTAQGALRTTLDTRAISHRIIHAGFVTQSQANEDRFYRDILNFHPMWHGGMHDDVTDWSSMQVPEGTDWIEYMLRTRPDASAATRGVLNHVSLGVQNMPATLAKLKENGCDTKECAASQMGRDGKVQLNLYDPDHTRFEVMEFTPTGTVCCSPYTGKMPSASDPM